MKPVVYTVLFGGYDTLRPPKRPNGSRFVCFTDGTANECEGWEIRHSGVIEDAERSARFYKINGFAALEEELSIYVDANIEVTESPERLVDLYLRKADIALHTHPLRGCIYQEAATCSKLKKAPSNVLQVQINNYRRKKYPVNAGLYETGVLIRRRTPDTIRLASEWMQQILQYSNRDQISLPFVLHDLMIRVDEIPGKLIRDSITGEQSAGFEYHPHGQAAGMRR